MKDKDTLYKDSKTLHQTVSATVHFFSLFYCDGGRLWPLKDSALFSPRQNGEGEVMKIKPPDR